MHWAIEHGAKARVWRALRWRGRGGASACCAGSLSEVCIRSVLAEWVWCLYLAICFMCKLS